MKFFIEQPLTSKEKNELLKKRPGAQDVHVLRQGNVRLHRYSFGVRGAWYYGEKMLRGAFGILHINDDMLLVTWEDGTESFLRPSDMKQSEHFTQKTQLEEGIYQLKNRSNESWILRIADLARSEKVRSVRTLDESGTVYLLKNLSCRLSLFCTRHMRASRGFLEMQKVDAGLYLLTMSEKRKRFFRTSDMAHSEPLVFVSCEVLGEGALLLTDSKNRKSVFWADTMSLSEWCDSVEKVHDDLYLLRNDYGNGVEKYFRLSDKAQSRWFRHRKDLGGGLVLLTCPKEEKQLLHLGHMKAVELCTRKEKLAEDLYLLTRCDGCKSFLNTRTMEQSEYRHFVAAAERDTQEYELTSDAGSVAVLDTERMVMSPWQFPE